MSNPVPLKLFDSLRLKLGGQGATPLASGNPSPIFLEEEEGERAQVSAGTEDGFESSWDGAYWLKFRGLLGLDLQRLTWREDHVYHDAAAEEMGIDPQAITNQNVDDPSKTELGRAGLAIGGIFYFGQDWLGVGPVYQYTTNGKLGMHRGKVQVELDLFELMAGKPLLSGLTNERFNISAVPHVNAGYVTFSGESRAAQRTSHYRHVEGAGMFGGVGVSIPAYFKFGRFVTGLVLDLDWSASKPGEVTLPERLGQKDGDISSFDLTINLMAGFDRTKAPEREPEPEPEPAEQPEPEPESKQNQAPTIKAPSDVTATADAAGNTFVELGSPEYSDPETAKDKLRLKVRAVGMGEADPRVIGFPRPRIYTVVYEVSDGANRASDTQTVTILPPGEKQEAARLMRPRDTIINPTAQMVSVTEDDLIKPGIQGPVAEDSLKSDIADLSEYPDHFQAGKSYAIEWTATDDSGDAVDPVSSTLIINPFKPPKLVQPGDTIKEPVGAYTQIDESDLVRPEVEGPVDDGSIKSNLDDLKSKNPNGFVTGKSYQLVWTGKDLSGNDLRDVKSSLRINPLAKIELSENIRFKYDSDEPEDGPEGMGKIQELAAKIAAEIVRVYKTDLPKGSELLIQTNCHSSSEGKAQYNLNLSQRRAMKLRKLVYDALKKSSSDATIAQLKIQLKNFKGVGKGEAEPVNESFEPIGQDFGGNENTDDPAKSRNSNRRSDYVCLCTDDVDPKAVCVADRESEECKPGAFKAHLPNSRRSTVEVMIKLP